MPPVDTVTVIPSWIWEMDFTNDPSSATTTWTDITPFVRGATTKRGRQIETAQDQAGTCTLDLDNRDRRFDWWFEGLLGNLVTNPSFELALTDYSGLAATISQLAAASQFGGFGASVVTTNVASSGISYGGTVGLMPVVPGLNYIFSLFAKLASAGSVSMQVRIDWQTAGGGLISSTNATVTLNSTSHAQFSVSGVAPATADHARLRFLTTGASGIFTFHTDGWQLEQASSLGSYCDGSQAGCHWSGTAHASISYRNAPYWPNVKPMRRVRCQAVYAAVTYPVFYGYLDDPVQDYPDQADAILHVSATDGFKVLANKLVSGDFPAQRSDQRVGAVLDAIGWPASQRTLATGVSMLDAITLDKVGALDHLFKVAETESGRLFMNSIGNVRFIDRHAAYLSTSQGTFGESEILYAGVVFGGGEQQIVNEILCQRATEGSEQRSATDATSAATYFSRSLSHDGLLNDTDNECSDKAAFELALYKDYHPRIVSLALDGTAQPATLWPQALGRALSDRVTVRFRPPGGGAMIEQESFIEGIEHTIGVGTWDTVFRLSSVGIGYQIYISGQGFFVLGDATLGKVGSSGTPKGVLAY